jgi:hypothetical protein
MKRTTARGVTVLGAAVLVAIALAACGGGGSSPTSTTSSKTAATNAADTQGRTSATGSAGSARRTALVACLKKYGVTLPSSARGGTSGRRFGFGATGASGRHFPFGATGASGPRGAFPGAGGGFPGGGGPGTGGFASNPKLAQALQKCGGLGGAGRFGATGRSGAFNFSTRIRTELTTFVACMKNHGETLPTPNLSGTGSVFGKVNQTSASFKAAYAQCKGILTYLNRPGGPTGTPGPTS